jgi:Icc-related predicted phosphoesterase
MNALCISDTHGSHEYLEQYLWDPKFIEDIDVIICAGDASNSKDPGINNNELRDFLEWFDDVEIVHKIFVPGNHDTSFEKGLIKKSDFPDINFLVHESLNIEGVNFFGSPYTPTFGSGWAYNVARNKINRYWDQIPDDTDILITHGPPKGILDATAQGVYYNTNEWGNYNIISCGDSSLLKKILGMDIKYHVFGHIHNEKDIINHGYRIIDEKVFVNASICNLKSVPVNKPIKIVL